MSTQRCHACADGRHGDCVDAYVLHDVSEAMPPLCGCEEGDCAPAMTWACESFLHDCGGCACPCHDDPVARAIWKEAHDRYLRSLRQREDDKR